MDRASSEAYMFQPALQLSLLLSILSVMQCLKQPVPILVGYLAQYIVKPVLGWAIARVRPPPDY